MSLNKQQVQKKLSPITSTLLKEKDYISFVDVLIGMGYRSSRGLRELEIQTSPISGENHKSQSQEDQLHAANGSEELSVVWGCVARPS